MSVQSEHQKPNSEHHVKKLKIRGVWQDTSKKLRIAVSRAKLKENYGKASVTKNQELKRR